MPYSINKFNGQVLSTVEDGTVDTKYSVKLVGKNYAGYGEIQNENFVFLLENFANTNPPANPLTGQMWYDTTNKRLKFYNQTTSTWKAAAVSEASSVLPSASIKGDIWWHDTDKQLKVYDGSDFVLIGPQSVAGAGTTQMRSRNALDTDNNTHPIIEAIVDGVPVFVISTDTFTISLSDDLSPDYTALRPGLNLPYSDTGVTDTNNTSSKFQGTATNALKLDGKSYAEVVSAASTGNFNDAGLTVGDSNDLAIFIDNGVDPVFKNAQSSKIKFQTTSSGTKTPLVLDGVNILPGSTAISNIGSNSLKFNTVYAASFNGVSTNTDTLLADGGYRYADKTALPNTIACRDLNSDIFANLFQGTATAAYYADLAEKYLADQEYETGTVVEIGGEAEVTACSKNARAIGAVSANPAYMMNSGLVGGTYIALKGRVPVKVVGEVKKGDELVASDNGCAEALTGPTISKAHFHVFAIALESSAGGSATIEALIL